MAQVTDRSELIRALEQAEVRLVRARLENSSLIDEAGEAAIRTAIAYARLHDLAGPSGVVHVEPSVLPLREEALKLLRAAGLMQGALSKTKLRSVAALLRQHVLKTRALLESRFGGALGGALEEEVRQKRLVLALGGGGGVAWSYLGAFKRFEEEGLTPALIAGASMGSALGLFRARSQRFSLPQAIEAARALSAGKLFRALSVESRYGVPAFLRLYLRSAIGHLYERGPGDFVRLSQLPIPLIPVVTGIKASVLPRPLGFYEQLLGDPRLWTSPLYAARRMPRVVLSLAELLQISARLDRIAFGLEEGTDELDAVDAVGFSSAVPGVLHYDVTRDDPRTCALLENLFLRKGLFRLADGGLVENVPARTAWEAVQRGMIGTRNVLIVALDSFVPKLLAPHWLPVQALIWQQVQRSKEWGHLYLPIASPLSPLELAPAVPELLKALEVGEAETTGAMPFIRRMMARLPRLE